MPAKISAIVSRAGLRPMPSSAGNLGSIRDYSTPSPKRPFFFWLTLTIALIFAGIYGYAGWMVIHYEPETAPSWWEAGWNDGAWRILVVGSRGLAAGKLEVGDQILAFDGDTRAAGVGPRIYQHALVPGAPYSLRVQRQSHVQDVSLSMPRGHGPGALPSIVSYLLVSLSFCGVAVLLGLYRPDDRVTQLG